MPKPRYEVHQQIIAAGLVPLFYHPEPEVACQLMAACCRAGARAVEFTNRGTFAHEVFGEMVKYAKRHFPDLLIGIGSLQDAGTTALYIQLGADFVITPMLREDIVQTCNRRKIACIPGVATPTEIGRAEELGVEIVKISPGEVLGPGFVKAHLRPCPWTNMLISSGVSPEMESLRTWFDAGASCVGMGSKLITTQIMQDKNYDLLEQNTRAVLERIQTIRTVNLIF